MILYPTETIYGIGVNPFDKKAVRELFDLKGRDERKVSAWLVPGIEALDRYGKLSPLAVAIAHAFLPGALTLVVPADGVVPKELQSETGTIGLRVSADPYAQALIKRVYEETGAPLTCTSANVSGLEPEATVDTIVAQFKKYRPHFSGFTEVIDGGVRSGSASTVVGVVGDTITVYRVGAIPESAIRAVQV